MSYYTDKEISFEKQKRIFLSVYALAYEDYHDSLISDAEFDAMAKTINLEILTGNKILDDFFIEHFVPFTGVWIGKHPELDKVEKTYFKMLKYIESIKNFKPFTGLDIYPKHDNTEYFRLKDELDINNNKENLCQHKNYG